MGINNQIQIMKFATLAMVAVVSATSDAAPVATVYDAAKCAPPSAGKKAAYGACNATALTLKGCKKTYAAAITELQKLVSDKDLDACYKTNSITTDADKADSHKVGGKCASDWKSYVDAEDHVVTA